VIVAAASAGGGGAASISCLQELLLISGRPCALCWAAAAGTREAKQGWQLGKHICMPVTCRVYRSCGGLAAFLATLTIVYSACSMRVLLPC
jgi:hypothetical protein